MGLNVGVQGMISKFGSFSVSESAAYSSCFLCRQWRTMPYYRNSQAHILLFSGDLPLCLSTSVLSASLPSASLQTIPSLSCQPRRQAELNQTNLQKGKRHHQHSSPPLPPLLLRHSWHLVNEKLCHIWWGAERKQWNTRESSPLGVQSILQGLRCSVAGWLLSLSSSLENGGLSTSDNTPLCNQDGLESATITTVAKRFENCGILWNSLGPFSSIPFSSSQILSVLSRSDYSWCFKCTKSFFKMLFLDCILHETCRCSQILVLGRHLLLTADD